MVAAFNPKVDAARRRLAQALDPALAGKRDRIGCGKVELLHVERVVDEGEAGIELARGDVGQKQLADPQGHPHIVVMELGEKARLGGWRGRGRRALLRRRRSRSWRGKPGLPDRSVAEELAEIELVAVERQFDLAALATLEAQVAAELGVAQLADAVGKGELAVADGGVGRQREIAHRGLRGHVAVARAPAAQRAQARAFELHRAGEHGSELAMGQLAGNLDAVIAGQRGLEMLDLEAAVAGRDSGIEIADEIAAKPGLIDGDGERRVAELGGIAQRLLGEQVKHLARRRPLAAAGSRRAEQSIEIDPAGL